MTTKIISLIFISKKERKGENKLNEMWKNLSGYEGLYQVSSLGRVRSLDRIITDSHCSRLMKGKFLKATTHNGKHPYKYVSLSKKGHIEKAFIHQLVAKTFIPNPKEKPQVNHIDGDPTNNILTNLEWVTNAENTQHAYDNLLNQKKQLSIRYNGETHSLRKWCKLFNLDYKKTWNRYKVLGWSIQRCFESEVMFPCHK